MRKLIYLLSLVVVSVSCKEDIIEPVSGIFFEFTVDRSFRTDQSDDWLILHDKNGNIIDTKKFETGDALTFDSTLFIPDRQIGVTLLQVTYFNGVPSFHFKSYLTEQVNTRWKLSPGSSITHEESEAENAIGSFVVQVKDVNFGPTFESQLSNKRTSKTPEVYQVSPNSFKHKEHQIYPTVDDYFLFVVDDNNTPKYRFLENVTPGHHKLSFTELSEFDRVVDVNFPATACSGLFIQAYEKDQEPGLENGYYTNYYYNSGLMLSSRSNFKAGYLDRFTKYRTRAFARYTNSTYTYHALGPAPREITFPLQASFTLHDKSFRGFKFAAESPFLRRTSVWFFSGTIDMQSVSITWEVDSSPSSTRNINELPHEILDAYPYLNLDNLQHQKSIFYTTADPFGTYLEKTFKEGISNANFIEIAKEIR